MRPSCLATCGPDFLHETDGTERTEVVQEALADLKMCLSLASGNRKMTWVFQHYKFAQIFFLLHESLLKYPELFRKDSKSFELFSGFMIIWDFFLDNQGNLIGNWPDQNGHFPDFHIMVGVFLKLYGQFLTNQKFFSTFS